MRGFLCSLLPTSLSITSRGGKESQCMGLLLDMAGLPGGSRTAILPSGSA